MENDQTINDKITMNDIGMFLMEWSCCVLMLTSMLLLIGVSIQNWYVYISFFLCAAGNYILSGSMKKTIKLAVLSAMIFVVLLLAANSIFSAGWDGETYHKPAIGLLCDSWNPVYMSALDYAEHSDSLPYVTDQFLWSEVYPKANWYFAACIYKAFGFIEMGKVTTSMFMVISFCLYTSYLKERWLKRYQAVIAAGLISCNPISLNHCMQYYLDGLAVQVLTILLLGLFMTVDRQYKKKEEAYGILFCMLLWGCNLKFSVLFFTALYCIFFFVIKLTELATAEERKKVFCFYFLSTAYALCVIGFAPYITNIVRYKNPFYGFLGKTGVANRLEDIIPAFQGFHHFSKFLLSLFSRMAHGADTNDLHYLLKVPFTYNESEMNAYYLPDTMVGGMGVFFGGSLIVAVIVLIVTIVCVILHKLTISREVKILLLAAAVVVLSCGCLPGTAQARYIGHIMLIPVLALIAAMNMYNCIKIRKGFRYIHFVLSIMLAGSLAVNLYPYKRVIQEKYDQTLETKKVLYRLKGKKADTILLRYDFVGLLYNLKDYKVRFLLHSVEEADQDYIQIYYNWISVKE